MPRKARVFRRVPRLPRGRPMLSKGQIVFHARQVAKGAQKKGAISDLCYEDIMASINEYSKLPHALPRDFTLVDTGKGNIVRMEIGGKMITIFIEPLSKIK